MELAVRKFGQISISFNFPSNTPKPNFSIYLNNASAPLLGEPIKLPQSCPNWRY